jgi:hypothetical protein
MKKILLPLLFLLLGSVVVQAQTKEETIAWLKQKLDNYLVKGAIYYGTYSNIKVESLDECELVISYIENQVHTDDRSPFTKRDRTYHRRIIAPISFLTQTYPYFKYDAKVVKMTEEKHYLIQTIDYPYSKREFTYPQRSDFRDFIALTIDNREENINERVMKAFSHLATFCPKKKEAF